MTKVAASPIILKKRLQRFFNSTNKGRQQVQSITVQLQAIGQVYLFGGAIRDIALEGMRNFYADLDFVIDAKPDLLDKLMAELALKYTVHKNKFGGYRLLCDKWWLDIWALSNTWAFKQKHVQLDNIESLLKTTILNWDAALYSLNSQQVLTSGSFFTHLTQGYVDINLATNPNPLGAYVRVLRTLCSKKVTSFSVDLARYLLNTNTEFSIETALSYETSHFKTAYLSQFNLSQILQASQAHHINPIPWHISMTTLPLLLESDR